MRFQFTETMRGWMDEPSGNRAAFEFTITARAQGYVSYALGDPLLVEGAVSLQGIADNARASGTLKIALPVGRLLRYDISFEAPDGARYRYIGRKDIRYLHFLRTMSWLKGTLFRSGEPVGRAELWFDYRDLPRFLLSFRPGILPAVRHEPRLGPAHVADG
jgi:hypothetical protein